MRERPFGGLSAYQRDVMMILADVGMNGTVIPSVAPVNGMDVRRDLQVARDRAIDPRSVYRILGELEAEGFVDVEDQGAENSYRLSDDGREQVERDLDWLRER